MINLTRSAMALLVGVGSLVFLAEANTVLAEQIKKPIGTTPGKLVAPKRGVRVPAGVIELTTSECTTLGGTVDASSKACTDKGYFTCKTVDSQGTARTACIDNK